MQVKIVTYLIILNWTCPWIVLKWMFLGSIQKYDGELYLYCKISQEWQIRLGLLVLMLRLWIDWIYIWLIYLAKQAKWLLFYLSVDGEDWSAYFLWFSDIIMKKHKRYGHFSKKKERKTMSLSCCPLHCRRSFLFALSLPLFL